MKDVIIAERLTKKFEDLTAVDGITFAIHEGECFGFLGPNGAGKTTTIRMIQCVSPVTSGKLSVLDLDVNKDQRRIKASLGVAPQEDNLDPDFTVFRNLVVHARYFGIERSVAEKKAHELLEFMQLTEKADVLIPKISGGMKRRLIMARALINEPRLLILDEPTTGLDPQARHLIWDKIRELKKKGVTVLITTHYMDEAQQLCDRLVIMEKGKIMVEGKPLELIESQVGRGVVEIINPEQGMEEVLRSIGFSPEKGSDRIFVYTNDRRSVRERLLKELPHANVVARDATLEDVFLRLTGRGLKE
jgi:lipooligosaccharide transport system ATP-binding protein